MAAIVRGIRSRARLFDNRRGAQGQEPHHGANLKPLGAAVGEPQQVVVEAVLLVPHAILTGPVHGRSDVVEVLDELHDHALVGGVVGGELEREFQHVLAEQGHPGRAVRLLEVAAGGKRGAAVEDADVVETEEASFEHVLAEAVLAVYPPGEVQQELVERRPEEIHVRLAAQGLLGAMQEQGRPSVDRGVHVAEVPLIGGHLAVGVQVNPAEHQIHLLLGEVGVHDRERERVEGQVPGRVPGVLPLVGHGDDVLVQHVEPLRVPGMSVSGMERVGVVLVQPVVTVEEEELLAPEHAGDGLAHHVGRVFTHRWRRDRLVKLIGFTKPISEDFIKLLSEGFARLVRRTVGEPQANHFGLTGAYIDLVVRRDLGARLAGVHRALVALHHAVVDAVLDIGALVLLPGEKQLVVCFVLGEEQRHIAFAGKDVFTQQRMRYRDRARARRGLDLA